jgi:MYXO-CTERM domain-containing protein
MRHLAKALSALVAVVWLAPAAARADIPPPDGYQEACTQARQEGANEYCKLYSASYKDPWGCSTDSANKCTDASQGKEVCCAAWITAGWSYRCKTYGASAFQAMWCRARQPTDPPKPDGKVSPGDSKVTSGDSKVTSGDGKAPLPPASENGCAVSGAASAAPLLILALPLLVVLALRRRR